MSLDEGCGRPFGGSVLPHARFLSLRELFTAMEPIQHRDGLATTKDRRDTDTIASPLAARNDLATSFAGWLVECLLISPLLAIVVVLFVLSGRYLWSDPKAGGSKQPSLPITFDVPPPRDPKFEKILNELNRKFGEKKTAEPAR